MKKKTNYYWKGNRNQNKIKINIRRNKKEEGEDRRLPTVETRCCCPINSLRFLMKIKTKAKMTYEQKDEDKSSCPLMDGL